MWHDHCSRNLFPRRSHLQCNCKVFFCVLFNSKSYGKDVAQEMIKRTYRLPGTKPDHIFFDNNCSIAKAVKSDPFFQDIGLTVDVFHFKCKHSEKDRFCQENCNPAAYPELLGEGQQQWYFNSSVAEQTNSWLGGYHAICREMTVHRYNFFLDEMIRRRNLITLDKLIKGTQEPGTWPLLT